MTAANPILEIDQVTLPFGISHHDLIHHARLNARLIPKHNQRGADVRRERPQTNLQRRQHLRSLILGIMHGQRARPLRCRPHLIRAVARHDDHGFDTRQRQLVQDMLENRPAIRPRQQHFHLAHAA